MYNSSLYPPSPNPPTLLRSDVLQLSRTPKEVIRIRLWYNLPRVGLLHEILISLLLCESNGVLLALERDVCALHEIGRRLPSHQRVFPSVSLGEDIPIHAPVLTVPFARLRCCLGRFVDSMYRLGLAL